MKIIIKTAVAVSAFLLSATLYASDKPNLLIIQTDEHHFGTLGCYGGTIVETQNIDWLAEQGVLCTSFYAVTPVCSPSRASLISGRYPQKTPVVTNNIPLNNNVITFASILGQQGYATGFAHCSWANRFGCCSVPHHPHICNEPLETSSSLYVHETYKKT